MAAEKIIKSSVHNNNSFFSSGVCAGIEVSMTLSFTLLRWYIYFTLLELVSGNEIPNPPFLFAQDDTLYNLTILPQIKSNNDSHYAWEVFQTIVEYLLSGKLDPITPLDGGNVTSSNIRKIWSAKVCEADIVLESNGTQGVTKFFLLNLLDMLKNDSTYKQALHCNQFSMTSIIMLTVTGGVTLFACCALVAFVIFLIVRACNHREYAHIQEVSQPSP